MVMKGPEVGVTEGWVEGWVMGRGRSGVVEWVLLNSVDHF